MRHRVEPAERLLVGVETARGSGDFKLDERLLVEEVHQRSGAATSAATISVRIDDEFDAEEARRRYHPDLRLVVMTDEAEPARREILFEGYPPVQSTGWDGRVGAEEERYVFEAEHVYARLGRAREALIFGRYMRNGEIEDALAGNPDEYADKSILITALPCVFNPDGASNRAAEPLTVRSPEGQPRPVHVFTWENVWHRKWTYATALRYLVWFYLPQEGPVYEGNIFTATDALAEDGAVATDALSAALLREPASLTCEATNLLEALSLLTAAAGLHLSTETENRCGRAVTKLRLWAAEDGPLRRLYLVRSGRHADGTRRFDAGEHTVPQILAANNVYRGTVTWDHRHIVNSPVVIGDVKRYEMTVPLWPGWIPRDNLDGVAEEDRAAAKALALTPDQVEALGDAAEDYYWFRRYHRRGSEFNLERDTSRWWVLNEDGFFGGPLYNRNAPFDDYQPFDFSTVADATVLRKGAWTRRPRRLLPTITTSAHGRALGVWVQISFDSGGSWQQQSGAVRVLEDRVGIYFDCESPTEITPTGVDPADQNLWYALIEQTFRVRVTGVIESDERLLGTYPANALASPTLQQNAMVVRRPKSFQFVSAAHTSNVLSLGGMQAAEGRDDSAAIAALAEQLARINQDRQVQAAPTIPWIETGYALGERIEEIRGRHLRLATTVGAELNYPAVLERHFGLRDGRYETTLTLGITAVPAEAVGA